LEAWLLAHRCRQPARNGRGETLAPVPAPQFLTVDEQGETFLIRWPNCSLRWWTRAALVAKGVAVPDRMLVDTWQPTIEELDSFPASLAALVRKAFP
jgi:hypothetical protein